MGGSIGRSDGKIESSRPGKTPDGADRAAAALAVFSLGAGLVVATYQRQQAVMAQERALHNLNLAIEAVDRAMRGEKSPSPIYEGEDSVIAWMLGGPDAVYEVPLPEQGS